MARAFSNLAARAFIPRKSNHPPRAPRRNLFGENCGGRSRLRVPKFWRRLPSRKQFPAAFYWHTSRGGGP
jgi:hypothetical protein